MYDIKGVVTAHDGGGGGGEGQVGIAIIMIPVEELCGGIKHFNYDTMTPSLNKLLPVLPHNRYR